MKLLSKKGGGGTLTGRLFDWTPRCQGTVTATLLTSPMAAVASAPNDADCPAPWAGGPGDVHWHLTLSLRLLGRLAM